jgi:hypothetical protein
MANGTVTPAPSSGYRVEVEEPNDSDAGRSRFPRMLSALLSAAALFNGPATLLGYWGSLMGQPYVMPAILIGYVIGGILLARISPRLFVYNPEWGAYVTQNMFTGSMIPYGPGFHLSHFWEERNQSGNYSLKVIPVTFQVTVPTSTAAITVVGKYEYAFVLARLTTAIGIDKSTFDADIKAFIGSVITAFMANMNAEQARNSISEMNERLSQVFMGTGGHISTFEMNYGITIASIVIENMKFSDAVQKTRDAKDEASGLLDIVATIHGYTSEELKALIRENKISTADYQKMLNRALAASENAKMDITVIEGDIPAYAIGALANFAKGRSDSNQNPSQKSGGKKKPPTGSQQ